MSITNWFSRFEKRKNQNKNPNCEKKRLDIPSDLWVKCFSCHDILYLKDLECNYKVCPACEYHFRLSPQERLTYFFDNFDDYFSDITPTDFLKFTDTESYATRLTRAQKKVKQTDAVTTGIATLGDYKVGVGIMNFAFMGGSMGCVVGEKLTRLIELACDQRLPVIIFTASGGARMQEGISSLMQMAKTSGALAKLSDAGLAYITVLCDPTTGGTSASFGMLGDVSIAEPGALITFAGPRVIEQTIGQTLPKGFQRSEFLLENGMVDQVVHRRDLKDRLLLLVSFLK